MSRDGQIFTGTATVSSYSLDPCFFQDPQKRYKPRAPINDFDNSLMPKVSTSIFLTQAAQEDCLEIVHLTTYHPSLHIIKNPVNGYNVDIAVFIASIPTWPAAKLNLPEAHIDNAVCVRNSSYL